MRYTWLIASLFLIPGSTGFGVLPELASVAPAAQSLLDTAVSGYQEALATSPLTTQVETGIALAVVGDAIAQKTQTSDQPYNANRAVSFAAFDACYRALQHFAYPPMIAACSGAVLGQLLPDNINFAAALEQALVSQLILIPLLYYPPFFAITGLVQGLTLKETIDRAKETAWPLMIRNWLFWIPIQLMVFAFVDDQNIQIPILIATGLVWTIILSAFAGAATPKERFNEPVENILTASETKSSSFGSITGLGAEGGADK